MGQLPVQGPRRGCRRLQLPQEPPRTVSLPLPAQVSRLLALLAALQHDTLPVFPCYPVCTECRNRENLCLLIERNELCLGPLIQAGCNARCPAVGIVCEGCRGPVVEANVAAELELLMVKGFSRAEIVSRMRRFLPEWNYEQRH